MANLEVTEVTGFKELNANIKRLNDRMKRSEVLKLMRRLARPVVQRYKTNLPIGSRFRKRTTKDRFSKRTGKKISSGDTFSYTPGNLRRSVRVSTTPSRFSGGNPAIAIFPVSIAKDTKGKLKTKKGNTRADGYYRFMIVPKGTKLSGRGRGSRAGKNTVVPIARDRTLNAMESGLVQQSEEATTKYVQKQIDRLSRR